MTNLQLGQSQHLAHVCGLTILFLVDSGGVIIVGGPMLIRYVSPSEEELRERYNPDLRRRSLENRDERIRESEDFAQKMIEYSKSNRPIWTVWKEDAMKKKKEQDKADRDSLNTKKSIAEEMKKQRLEGGE